MKVTFGYPDCPTKTTLKVEDDRVMLAQVKSAPGEVLTQDFTLNIRTPAIPGGDPVKIYRRESGPPVIRPLERKNDDRMPGLTSWIAHLENFPE